MVYIIIIFIVIIIFLTRVTRKHKEYFTMSQDDIKDIKYISKILNGSKTTFTDLELVGDVEVNNTTCKNITNNNISIKEPTTFKKVNANNISCKKLTGDVIKVDTNSYFKDLNTKNFSLGGFPPFTNVQIPSNLKCKDLGLTYLTKDACKNLPKTDVSNITKYWKEGCMYSQRSDRPYYNTYTGEGLRGNQICTGTCNTECQKKFPIWTFNAQKDKLHITADKKPKVMNTYTYYTNGIDTQQKFKMGIGPIQLDYTCGGDGDKLSSKYCNRDGDPWADWEWYGGFLKFRI
jgi:hypothetical protein